MSPQPSTGTSPLNLAPTHVLRSQGDRPPDTEQEIDLDAEEAALSRSRDWPAIEGYEILDELGRGNMGVVYKARQVSLNRVVALKMIRSGAHASSEELHRFVDEARLVALLHHPNIIQIHDIGLQDGLPYFSMEYVPGGTLADQLKGRPQPTDRAAQLTLTLARAINCAHAAGIVHRDLKPANILIAETAGRDSHSVRPSAMLNPHSAIKITDFGLAKHLTGGSGQTQSGMVMGTPNYMAPEQAEGRSRDVGPAADLYALGAILYEMLTGRPPYNAESPAETLLQIFHADPVLPSRLQPKVPRDLETICLKCLSREPHKRYATADDLADDLQRFLSGESIAARRASLPEQAWKWACRRPAMATLSACVATGTLVLVALGVWHQTDLRTRLTKARAEEREARLNQEAFRKTVERTELEARVKDALHDAEAALSHRDWRKAQLLLAGALAQVETVPELGELKARAATLLRQANEQQTDRDRYARFVQRRHDALFNATLFTGGDLAASLKQTRAAALEALALYGVAPEGGAPDIESPHLQEGEKQAIRTGCYELLLVLAEAVAQPLPGQPEDERRRQAADALRLLDRAARLGPPTRAYHLRRAHYLDQSGDDAAARQERERADALEPTSSLDHFLVGADHYRRNRYEKSLESFEAALRLQPDHFWAQYYLALGRLKRGRFELAAAGLTACLGQRPDFAWLYLLRGSAHTQLRQFAAAAEDFDRASALVLDDDARYGLLVNRGVLRIQQGNFPTAADDLSRAVGLRPGLYQGHANLAQAYLRQQKTSDALRALAEAVRCEPNLAALYRTRAGVHLQRQDFEAALADFDRSIEKGAVADDHLERAKIFLRRRQHREAAAACEAALALQAKLPNAHRLRAEALLELERYAEARQSLDECLKHSAPTSDVYRTRAAVFARMNQIAPALTDYTRALDLQPDAATFTARGWAYVVMDAPKLALADFDEAIRREPVRSEAYAGRGMSRVLLGDVSRGVLDAEEALRRGPETPRLLYSAARVFAQAKARLEADSDPRSREAYQAERHQARAVELLTRALENVPPQERAAFWKNCVRADAALSPLRRSTQFGELALRYADSLR